MTTASEVRPPPLLVYPPRAIRDLIPADEWNSYLEIWKSSLQTRLSLSNHDFSRLTSRDTGTDFLSSYLVDQEVRGDHVKKEPRENDLRKTSYLLTQRILKTKNEHITASIYFEILGSGSIAFRGHKSWTKLLHDLWLSNSPPTSSNRARIQKAVEAAKASLSLASHDGDKIRVLKQLSAVTMALPEIATIIVAGADYLDSLTEIYSLSGSPLQKNVTANTFYSFCALISTKHISALTDNLYHMKSEADASLKSQPDVTTLLSSLLCTTTFLTHLSSGTDLVSKKASLVNQLKSYRESMLHLHPPPPRKNKGKGKERSSGYNGMHMHRAAQISQVHELFPDLTNTYILRCLDYFQDNTESVIAALLEPELLPTVLQDRSVPDIDTMYKPELEDLQPRSTPPLPPQRHGTFDNDAFSRLEISAAQIRRGKKDLVQESDTREGHARSKAAILSALAAFDSDDDERDDTYDVADVGGAVDNTVDRDDRARTSVEQESDPNEAVLFKIYKENPDFFNRDSKTRASSLRAQVKREVNMTDEQLEGWAIVLRKDPKLQQRLEQKHSVVRAFTGTQKLVQSTKWQSNTSAENSEIDSGPESTNNGRRVGQAGIRGHRDWGSRGQGRGAGSTSGPSEDATTQAARRRKEQGRGRGGANGRRAGRARKMARGMGPLPPA